MPRNRKLFLWPAAAVLIGALVSINPFYTPEIPLQLAISLWFVDMAFALVCWLHPIIARAGVVLTGLFMAVPGFLDAPPLFRGWLMCGTLIAVALASAPVLVPSVTGFRARLAVLCSWGHTRELKRSPRYFDAVSLLQLILAIIVAAGTLGAVESVPASGLWYLVRWLAGGVMVLAVGEFWTAFHNFLSAAMGLTAPSLMQSPFLSTSISQFWTKRWNPGTSYLLHRFCFEPLARCSPVWALIAVFAFSAAGHALAFHIAGLRWEVSLINGSFFLVQPFFILTERQLNVHRWPATAARAWTLSVLAITSPLFIEPGLQIIECVLGSILKGTLMGLSLVMFMEIVFLLAALFASSCTSGSRSAIDGARMLH